MSLDTKIKPQTAINCNLHSERKQVAQKIVFDICAVLAKRMNSFSIFNSLRFRTNFSGKSRFYIVLLVTYSLVQPGFLFVAELLLELVLWKGKRLIHFPAKFTYHFFMHKTN